MLALKKKREDEAKAKAGEEAAMAAATTGDEVSQTPGTAPATKVSLLGIGGKKKKADGTGGATGQKKRSPGEIRIQKGEKIMRVIYILPRHERTDDIYIYILFSFLLVFRRYCRT